MRTQSGSRCEGAVHDYTSGALDGYDPEDVAGLLEDRLAKARERLEETREAVKALCEAVEPPKDSAAYRRYFCAKDSGDAAQLKESEPKRLALYRHVAAFVRAFANLANELGEAGYSEAEIAALHAEASHFEKVRGEVKLASGDAIDLKMYEPAMRHLIDAYIQADPSERLSAFDDFSLVQLIVERGAAAVDALPEGIRRSREATAEVIENNVRKLIIDEQPINPKYYEKMSELLSALIAQRKQAAIEYRTYLEKIIALTKQVVDPTAGAVYPKALDTPAKRALFDNLGRDERLALAVDAAIRASRQDEWRANPLKVKKVKLAIQAVFERSTALDRFRVPKPPAYRTRVDESLDALVARLLELAKNQREY